MKGALQLIADGYDRKARLYPALVCLAPVVAVSMPIIGANMSAVRSVAATIASCGGTFFLSQLARDAGKKREQDLYERWGGMPSVAIFRHRDHRLDAITKARYHKTLSNAVKARAPSPAEEEKNPGVADQTYMAWSNYLRVNTRDTKKYALVFHELVQYGFRRNLWGLRPLGITLSALSVSVAAAWSFSGFRTNGSLSRETVGADVLTLVFLLLWIWQFTPNWVRIPADAYAVRLAEATDRLKGKKPAARAAKSS